MDKTSKDLKIEAREMIDSLPDDMGWEEALRRIDVWVDILVGEADISAGRVYATEEVRRHFGFSE